MNHSQQIPFNLADLNNIRWPSSHSLIHHNFEIQVKSTAKLHHSTQKLYPADVDTQIEVGWWPLGSAPTHLPVRQKNCKGKECLKIWYKTMKLEIYMQISHYDLVAETTYKPL